MDELTESVLREPRDAEHRLVALDAGPVVLLVVLEVVRVRLGRGQLGTLLSLVDRALDDACAAPPAAYVDRDLRAGRRSLRRQIREPDAPVEHRRVRPGRDVAAAQDGHALPRHGLLLHHERDELALRPFRLDLPELVRARELLVERAGPSETRRDRVRVRRD